MSEPLPAVAPESSCYRGPSLRRTVWDCSVFRLHFLQLQFVVLFVHVCLCVCTCMYIYDVHVWRPELCVRCQITNISFDRECLTSPGAAWCQLAGPRDPPVSAFRRMSALRHAWLIRGSWRSEFGSCACVASISLTKPSSRPPLCIRIPFHHVKQSNFPSCLCNIGLKSS